MSRDIAVLGSANLDLVLRIERIPRPGETVLATAVARHPGGKGLNQAVAAARAGASTAFLATVGADDAGAILLAALDAEGIDTAAVRRSISAPTGLAVIAVEDSGENTIVVVPGANDETSPDAECEGVIRAASILVCQLEVPVEAVTAAARLARQAGVRVILNAAPAQPLEDSLLRLVDVLVVNEHEALILAGGTDDPMQAATSLAQRCGEVVVTLGAAGAAHVGADGVAQLVPGVPARAVDTTGAGDTFVGVLADALARGLDLPAAMARAVIGGALAVERPGASSSIPTGAQIDARAATGHRPTVATP